MKSLKFFALTLLPIIFCSCLNTNNNTHNEQPNFELKNVKFDESTYDCVILGGGIGGLTSSVYMAMAGFNPLIIQGDTPGGLITQSTMVENWPGETKITGQELAHKIQNQAISHGVNISQGRVSGVNLQTWPYIIYVKSLDNQTVTEIKTLTCIITMGTAPNLLGIPGETGENGYFGKGVSTCAICDGNLYKNKTVAVIGGGDSAATEAIYLSKLVKKVYMIARGEKLRANFANQNNLKSIPNIEVLFETKVTKIIGDGQVVTAIETLGSGSEIPRQITVDGVFLAIGAKPNTEGLKNQIQLDENGYIKLFNFQETSRKGIFAAGDISDPKFKQAITAAGDSTKAALQAIEFLNNIGYKPNPKSNHEISNSEIKKQTDQIETNEQESAEAKHGDIIDIDSDSQFEEMIKKSPVTVADFYGTFCVPCKQMHPIYQQAADFFGNNVKFLRVNVETNGALNKKYSITSVPTFIFFKNENMVKKFVGTRSLEALKKEIQDVVEAK